MRAILFLFFMPIFLFSQEFSPGSLSELEAPICYNTSVLLSFQTLPSGGDSEDYTYEWQKSWNGSNWFDTSIQENYTTSYSTEFLTTDTYYRVLITYQNTTIATNSILKK